MAINYILQVSPEIFFFLVFMSALVALLTVIFL